MIKKALPGLSLLTLSLFSGYVLANEATGASCEAVVQQLKQQADATNQLNTRLSMLLDQQGHTAKQLNEIKNLQQQLGKQLTPVSQPALYKKSNKKESAESCIPAEPGKTTPDGKMILGETEWIYVEEANGNFMSRVDTGATTSSISAHDVTVFEREGRRWVKFIMPIDGGKEINVEVPFVKYIRIRQANGLEDRPIVRMTIRLGSVTEKADFSLTDRSNMDFPVLLGREFMKDVAVVDVARENVQGKPKVADAVQASAKPKQLQVVKNLKASETETKTNNAANTVKEGDKVLTVKKVPVKDESGNAVSATDSSLKKETPKNDSVSDVKPTVDLKKPSKEPVKTALPADAEPVKASSAAATTSDVNKDKQ
ncbi:ATP-dependent zinc protease [Tolumonas lignilytica]|uniref:ATP-dependent zinc protease family protein n=1 Tax=Tolumonas lignilytica TaxID=1283284 RepID=UPI000465E741|nr:ATP-dependent zinc protease [Tolumonas lignilytica]